MSSPDHANICFWYVFDSMLERARCHGGQAVVALRSGDGPGGLEKMTLVLHGVDNAETLWRTYPFIMRAAVCCDICTQPALYTREFALSVYYFSQHCRGACRPHEPLLSLGLSLALLPCRCPCTSSCCAPS
jgi:hypothetical protein